MGGGEGASRHTQGVRSRMSVALPHGLSVFCSLLPFYLQEGELLRVTYTTRLVAYFTRGMGAKEEECLKQRIELLVEHSSG